MLHRIAALKDNYIWLLEINQKNSIIIDPGEAQPVIDYIAKKQLNPVAILLTHHHEDHIGGTTQLQQCYPNIAVFGPDEINLAINKISDQSKIDVEHVSIDIIKVPGHTLGHVAYYIKPYLFCGDTLFSAGCGRVFEGTYAQMLASLNKLKMLPDETITCPAHEYTLSNLKFAHHLMPKDTAINTYYRHIQGEKITLPTTIEKEKKINLFLRCRDTTLQKKFNIENELDLFVFFRTQKDIF